MKGRWVPFAVGLALTLAVLWLQFTSQPLALQAMQRLNFLAYDLRLEATLADHKVDPRVVIVDIDEKSLKAEGHWPWPRDRIALLVQKLFDLGARVVAFDMVFAEPERNSAETVLARLKGVERETVARVLDGRLGEFDNNSLLARELADREVVLGFIFHGRDERPVGHLPPPLIFVDPESAAETRLPEAGSYTGNILVTAAGVQGGFFDLLPDSDGIIRRAPMLQRFGDQIYPSLALETARLFLGVKQLELRTARFGASRVVETIALGERIIPTDHLGRAMVPFRGGRGSFPYISATDVLRDDVTGSPFADRAVLIGTTAQGLFDLRATPLQSIFPGVEVHANLIAGVLDNRFPIEPSWAPGANFAVTLLVGLLLSLLLPRLASWTMVVASLAVLFAVVGINLHLWNNSGLNLATAPPILLIGSISVFNIAYGFWNESRDRARLKAMFGQYVPPQLVEEMNRHPDAHYGFEGESRDMSVLFCDIRGFTTLSESLSAAKLKEMLNQFFTPMTRVIFEHRGTIDKYVGDMIMAFWSAPVEDPAHAEHAVGAALAILKEAERLSPEFAAHGLPAVRVGIGINTGVMNVGDMGSAYRRAYTVIGDTVNLASRLEAATRYYRVGVAIGEESYRRIAGAFVCRELDRLRVKGKQTAVTVYEPLCRREEITPALADELTQHDAALARFRARDWDTADAAFAKLQSMQPQVYLYSLYRERIATLRTSCLDEGWDGIFDLAGK